MFVTKNFTLAEFQCKCGQCNGGTMSTEFMTKLQAIRDAYGKPLTINSGFRCPEYNKSSGGSPGSMHMQGRAADIKCENGSEKMKLFMIAVEAGMNGVGVGKKFIHVDDRPDQVLWTY